MNYSIQASGKNAISQEYSFMIELIRITAVVLITFTHLKHNFSEGFMFYVLEEVPRYGTLILSVVSGFLFYKVSIFHRDFFQKKIHSLLLPYLIANLVVLLPVILFYIAGYNYLNRLQFDYTLITEGILSLNSPPVNPPTYFIRDLFVVFLLAEVVLNKNFKLLIFLLPLLFFGKLLLRYDILLMFISGMLFSRYQSLFHNKVVMVLTAILAIVLSWFLLQYEYHFHVIALFLFIALMQLPFKGRKLKTGGYSYMVHLYHSPLIVFAYPLLKYLQLNPYLEVAFQLALVFSLIYAAYKFTKTINWIRGGR